MVSQSDLLLMMIPIREAFDMDDVDDIWGSYFITQTRHTKKRSPVPASTQVGGKIGQ